MSQSDSELKVVYFGVININENQRTIGAVDIWRNVITKELLCEEKRLGVLDIAEHIGMPSIGEGKKWAVAISRRIRGQDRWKLVKLINHGKFQFLVLENKIVMVEVENHRIIDPEWWSFLVEKNVNRNVEITEEQNVR